MHDFCVITPRGVSWPAGAGELAGRRPAVAEHPAAQPGDRVQEHADAQPGLQAAGGQDPRQRRADSLHPHGGPQPHGRAQGPGHRRVCRGQGPCTPHAEGTPTHDSTLFSGGDIMMVSGAASHSPCPVPLSLCPSPRVSVWQSRGGGGRRAVPGHVSVLVHHGRAAQGGRGAGALLLVQHAPVPRPVHGGLQGRQLIEQVV